jgi:hypothetical protein
VLTVSLDVSLSKSKVQNENFVGGFVQADTKVVWLDVTVDKVTIVDVFDSLNHLIDQHQHCLQ